MSGYQNEAARQQMMNAPKLVVKIFEGRNLKAADFGGTSDPYAEIRIKGQTHSQKTKVIKKTLNPFWGEEFVLYPTNPNNDCLSIKVYDYDATTNNDILGEIEVPVAVLLDRPGMEKWYQLQRKNGTLFQAVKGEIRVFLQYGNAPPMMNHQVPPPFNPSASPSAPPQYNHAPPQNYAPPPTQYAPPQYHAPPMQQYPPSQYPQYPPPQQYPPVQYPPPQTYPPQYPPVQQYAPPQYPPTQAYPPPMQYGQYAPPQPTYYAPPQQTTMTYVRVPDHYSPARYSYSSSYNPHSAFVIPMGLPPHLHHKMMQASAAFRMFDLDRSGYLNKKEWKRALRHLGYWMAKHDGKRLFHMVDTDHSGRISEREFCEFWIQFGL